MECEDLTIWQGTGSKLSAFLVVYTPISVRLVIAIILGLYFMTFNRAISIVFILLFSSIVTACTPVTSEQSTDVVVRVNDWSVFVEENPRECWAATAAKNIATQRLIVFSRPNEGINEQIMFAAGFSLSVNNSVNLQIDGRSFTLYSVGETAWLKSPSEDAILVRSLKSGSRAVVTARTPVGAMVTSEFSLRGAADAISQATRLCSQ